MRVVVAMSGGVDSSVAAARLVDAGHEVVGLTMKLRDATAAETAGRGASCCSPDDLTDARLACDALGVPHFVVDYRDTFRERVIEPFAEAYLAGRTPNPCVACNDHVKFAPLLDRARALGADALATGHYARVDTRDGRHRLLKGVDPRKDQSYFLFGLTQEALAMTRFPLGELTKDQVREYARAHGLPNADKADSEDICFVPTGDYAAVVESVVGAERVPPAGSIVDAAGRALGQHDGVHHFTVGQRRGLKVAARERLYVLEVDGRTDTLVVGGFDDLYAPGLRAVRCHWISGRAPETARVCDVRVRYRSKGVSAVVAPTDEGARVLFAEPQRAIAPGQAVVFYAGDEVLGGGWIDATLPREAPSGRAHG